MSHEDHDLGPGSSMAMPDEDHGWGPGATMPTMPDEDHGLGPGPTMPTMPDEDHGLGGASEWEDHFGGEDDGDGADEVRNEPDDVRQDVADALDHEHVSPDALDAPGMSLHDHEQETMWTPETPVTDAGQLWTEVPPEGYASKPKSWSTREWDEYKLHLRNQEGNSSPEDEQTPERAEDDFGTSGDGDGDDDKIEDNDQSPEAQDVDAAAAGANFYGNVLGVVRNVQKQMDRASSSVHPLISDTEKILHHSKRYHQSLGQLENGLKTFSMGVKNFRTVTAERHREKTDELRASVSRGVQAGLTGLTD
jgi:hypothetical protein